MQGSQPSSNRKFQDFIFHVRGETASGKIRASKSVLRRGMMMEQTGLAGNFFENNFAERSRGYCGRTQKGRSRLLKGYERLTEAS